MTHPSDNVKTIAESLSEAQRRGLRDARPTGPGDDYYVQSTQDAHKIYAHEEELVSWMGRLLPLGLSIRQYLKDNPNGE